MIKETKIQINNYSHYKEMYPYRNSHGIAPQTMAVAFFMYAAGMKKLSSRNEMKELLLRTILIFNKLNLYENFLAKDYLMRFSYKGRKIQVTAEDFVNHTGMQLADLKNETPTRDEWIQKTGIERRKLKQEAALWFFTKSSILPDVIQDETPGYTWLSMSTGESKNEIQNAEILADCIIKDMSEIRSDSNKDTYNEKSCDGKLKDKNIQSEPPFFFDCWRRSEPRKINDTNRMGPSGETVDVTSNKNEEIKQKVVYIPWPFPKGSERRREYCRIDPSWN